MGFLGQSIDQTIAKRKGEGSPSRCIQRRLPNGDGNSAAPTNYGPSIRGPHFPPAGRSTGRRDGTPTGPRQGRGTKSRLFVTAGLFNSQHLTDPRPPSRPLLATDPEEGLLEKPRSLALRLNRHDSRPENFQEFID